MKKAALLTLMAALLVFPFRTHAEDKTVMKEFSPAEKAGIEAIIKSYLTQDHPEIVMEAARAARAKDEADAAKNAEVAIKANSDLIYKNPAHPVWGNPSGNVTVVEFFDYQCGYCKMAEQAMEKLLKDDGQIKMIGINFAVLGEGSNLAARAALASIKQTRDYAKFHNALLASKERFNEDILMTVAKSVGLDVEKLKKDMEAEDVKKQLDANYALGTAIGVRGTPMFIIGDTVSPGALPYEKLKEAVDKARAKPSAEKPAEKK